MKYFIKIKDYTINPDKIILIKKETETFIVYFENSTIEFPMKFYYNFLDEFSISEITDKD